MSLCVFPCSLFLTPSPSDIHLPSLLIHSSSLILWFSAWLPRSLTQDALSPQPQHTQHQPILLNMPTISTFLLSLLLVYPSFAYLTASTQERANEMQYRRDESCLSHRFSHQSKRRKIVCARIFPAHTGGKFAQWEWLLTEQALTPLGSVHQVQRSASSKSSLDGEEGNLCLSKSRPTTRGQNVVWTRGHVLHLNQKPRLSNRISNTTTGKKKWHWCLMKS